MLVDCGGVKQLSCQAYRWAEIGFGCDEVESGLGYDNKSLPAMTAMLVTSVLGGHNINHNTNILYIAGE